MSVPTTRLVYRHGPLVRIAHWVNVAALAVLLMSGLQIFNAHPALYWGHKSVFADPWLSIGAVERPDGRWAGVTAVGDAAVETTGVLGVSGPPDARAARAFPAWITAPSYQSLADGRRWHFLFAWLFVFNGAAYLASGLATGRLRRELVPGRAELSPRSLGRTVLDHLRLRFHAGEGEGAYNVLQKLSYLFVVAVALPLMLLTGLCMSPGVDAAIPWLVDVFGGRQSARSIHFLTAGTLVAFVAVHVAMVVASGPINNLRSMITGRYRIGSGP